MKKFTDILNEIFDYQMNWAILRNMHDTKIS